MTRRSLRLLSRACRNVDGDTDPSTTTSVSFQETPVRVCKKKRDTREASMLSKDESSSAGTEPPVTADHPDGASNIASFDHKGATKTIRHIFLPIIIIILCVFLLLPLMTAMTTSPKRPAELSYEHDHGYLTPELIQAVERWLAERSKELFDQRRSSDCGRPIADNMADFALETLGATVVRRRCSKTYDCPSTWTLFGFRLFSCSESPRDVIKGFSDLLPGRCWPFQGTEGNLFISLSHPVKITHVTLDHVPPYSTPTGRIDSAPKDFEIYGMVSKEDDGTLLGKFIYNKDGEPTQTFELPKPSEVVHRFVDLRVLSNWGQAEYTCLYRFRVHGTLAST